MKTAEIEWHGGNDLRLIKGTIKDGNEIINAFAFLRSRMIQESYMKGVVEHSTRKNIRKQSKKVPRKSRSLVHKILGR